MLGSNSISATFLWFNVFIKPLFHQIMTLLFLFNMHLQLYIHNTVIHTENYNVETQEGVIHLVKSYFFSSSLFTQVNKGRIPAYKFIMITLFLQISIKSLQLLNSGSHYTKRQFGIVRVQIFCEVKNYEHTQKNLAGKYMSRFLLESRFKRGRNWNISEENDFKVWIVN